MPPRTRKSSRKTTPDAPIGPGLLAHRLAGHNERFLREYQGLRYYGANTVEVLIGGARALHRVCLIHLTRSGSIYVQAPRFQARMGVAGRIQFPTGGRPATISLAERGGATHHAIKLHHPRDGRVHFSQDGKINTLWGEPSFRLDTGEGRIFELIGDGFTSFEPLDPDARLHHQRLYLPLIFTGRQPSGFVVLGHWQRKADLYRRDWSRGRFDTIGPLEQTKDARGQIAPSFFVGPAARAKIDSHILIIRGGAYRKLQGKDSDCAVILIGGHDEKPLDPSSSVPRRDALAFMYPVHPSAAMLATLASLDLDA